MYCKCHKINSNYGRSYTDSLIKTKTQPSIISMMIEIPSIRLAVAVNLEEYNLKGINYPSGNDD